MKRRLFFRLLAVLLILTSLSVVRPFATEVRASGYPLPEFELPYYAHTGAKWSGGPHEWGKGPNVQWRGLNSGSGLDFALGGKSFAVAAMAEGDVIWASETDQSGGLGIKVAVKHTVGGSVVIYGHLKEIWEPILEAIEDGETYHVMPGYTLGYAGNTGSTAVHLHIELRDGSRNCCGPLGDGGDPINWHSKEIGDFTIYDLRPNELGIGPGGSEVAYNYDGLAIRTSMPQSLGPVPYETFSFYDYTGELRTGVYTWLPNNFVCTANPCTNVSHSDVRYAGGDQLVGGSVLVSDLTVPTNQPQGASAVPGIHWLIDEAYTSDGLFNVTIHIKVSNDPIINPGFDAFRVCIDGQNCQESAAPINEIFYTWNTYGWSDGHHTISVQNRQTSDNGNWSQADYHETTYYLNPNRSTYAPCGVVVNGATLTSGSNCIKVTSNVPDLANANWADRNNLQITAAGYDVLAYGSPDYNDAPLYIRDGQTVSAGNGVSAIELRQPLGNSAYVPTQPLGTDSNTVSYLPLDEGSGTQVNDSVGSLDGTLSGSASFTTGRFGQAIAAPTTPSVSGLNFGAVNLGTPLTVELFVKFNSANNDQRIASQLGGGGNTGQNKWVLGLVGGYFRLTSCYTNGCHQAFSLETVQTNRWYYLMFTYDGSTTSKLYVDSLHHDTVTMHGVMPSGSTTFELGKGENIYGCDCIVDDLRISNIVREPVMPGVWNGGLVSNGSFETLTSGWANNWTRNNTSSVLIDTGSNGTHGSNSLRFTSDTANHHAFSGEISVSSANSYTWLSRVRSTSGSGEFGFYIDEYDSSHNWISGQWFSALPASVEGTKIISYKPSSSSVAYASLQYYMNANTSYEVYVDAVSFTQNTSSNLVTNGGFEYLLGGWADAWTRNNTSYITVSTSSQGNEGTNSLHFSPPSGNVHAFGTRFPVGSGTYTWSQYVVTTSGTGEFGFYIDEYDANGNWISGQWKGGIWGASSGVQSFSYTRSSSNVAFASPQLYVLSGTTFDVYVDSVSFGQ